MSIAVLVVLIAVAVYWYTVRPLPKTSGDLRAPTNAPATITRDERGVPHIEAGSWQDAIFLQGYVTAQDRLWQMDGLRRFGAGELAEVFGKSALANDEVSRRMRMRAMAEADVARLRPEDRAVMVEYARGVNYFIDTHRGDYPVEFSLPGHTYDPRPWTLTDSMLIGLVMFRNLADSASFEISKGNLMAVADPAKVRVLFPTTEGQYINPGSNAWAVSAAHAADGAPMEANDTHLSYGIPDTWHLVHLKAPGLNVSGIALPGVPGVLSGHNDQIAWGVTNLEADVMDLYVEQIDERTGRYVYQGKPAQAQLDSQVIGVSGGKPEAAAVWVTRHGPVAFHQNGKSYSMRWSAQDGFGFPFFDIDRARNWQEFQLAVSNFWGPAQSFVYADRAGNIGYQASGRMPIRTGFDGDVPLDGSSGATEWSGYIPFEQLPSVLNPPSGMIASANQDPFPPNFPYRVTGSYADRYRVEQIRNLLSAKSKLSVDDMLAIEKDVYSAVDYFLAQQVITAFDKRGSQDELVRSAIDVLHHWNGQMDKDEAAPMITQLLNHQIGLNLVQSLQLSSPEKLGTALGPPRNGSANKGGTVRYEGQVRTLARVNILPRPQVIQGLLNERPKGWVPNDAWDSWLIARLQDAIQEGRQRQGTPLTKWHWGGMLQWKFSHPVGNQIPIADRFFNIGPVQMSGSSTTVKQTTTSLGPSERIVVDFKNLDSSVANLRVGESGEVASRHYKDQWPAYYVGKSFPMEFNHVTATNVLRVQPE